MGFGSTHAEACKNQIEATPNPLEQLSNVSAMPTGTNCGDLGELKRIELDIRKAEEQVSVAIDEGNDKKLEEAKSRIVSLLDELKAEKDKLVEKALSSAPVSISSVWLPNNAKKYDDVGICLLYTSPSPRDQRGSRMPSSA